MSHLPALEWFKVFLAKAQPSPKKQKPKISLVPAEARERAAQLVGHDQNGTRNLVFLHFVGELLRSASCVGDDSPPSYEWFRTALELFDKEIVPLETEQDGKAVGVPLALFEKQNSYG